MKNFKEEILKKKAIRNFVLKNYRIEEDSEEIVEERIKCFLQGSIGPNEKGQVAVLDQGKILTITQKGNIFGPS